MNKIRSSAVLVIFLLINLWGCESTLYVIEEVEEVVPDEIKSPSDSAITSNIDTSEIKEDIKSDNKYKDKDIISREFAIQLGAFSNESNAINFYNKAKIMIREDVYYKYVQGLYKVRLGNFTTKAEALEMLEKIIANGFTDSFVVELTYVKVPE